LLQKFDTSLNLIWAKEYHPSGVLSRAFLYHLIVDTSGYVLCGGTDNAVLSSFEDFKSQSLLIKTDTSGVEQWHYASAVDSYKYYNSDIASAVHTQDGGYLFVTKGDVYNTRPDWVKPSIDLAGKTIIVKLDATRKKLWEIKVDSFYTNFGMEYHKLLEMKDASFIFCGPVITDSVGTRLSGYNMLRHYTKDGKLLYKHKFYYPKIVSDTSSSSGGPIFDFIQTIDKGFVLCGYYLNYTTGAPAPAQRGWLIKVDSNGCLGVGDPECWPTSIALPGGDRAGLTLSVYPNPSSNYYEIDYQNEDHSPATIAITDITGRAIAQYPLPQGKSRIEAQAWANGLYLYYIINKQGVKLQTGKLIKQ
jgi:hypothetical protein